MVYSWILLLGEQLESATGEELESSNGVQLDSATTEQCTAGVCYW